MEFLKLSSQKLVIIGIIITFLTGCVWQPFIDRRRNPGEQDMRKLYSGPSRPDAPVICYNGLITDDEELQQMADAECIKEEMGERAQFVEKKHFEGRLLLPSHAYYKCVKE